jgi:hypothetical protein
LGEDTFTMMAERAINVIDQVVVEQMQGKIDTKNNAWLIPILSVDVIENEINYEK